MKKIFLLFSLFAFLFVSANTKTQYPLSGHSAQSVTYNLPIKFNMDGWVDAVVYNSETGFVLSETTKDINIVWAVNPANDALRMTVIYSYSYTEEGNPVSGDNVGATEWVPGIGNNSSGSVDISNFFDIKTIKEKTDAVITIKKVQLGNFGVPSTDYELISAEIGGQAISNIYDGGGAKFYNGNFTVSNLGHQAFFINRFAIPEEYKGKYVRMDFSEEPANNWGLNFAYEDDINVGVDGGWTSLNNYAIKKGLSYYYLIPADAATINPQLWKSDEDEMEWTVKVAGFYLTNDLEGVEYYNDSYFPLTNDGVDLKISGDTNTFDEATKTFTFGSDFNSVGWSFGSALNFSGYDYLVVNFSTPPTSYIEPRFNLNGTIVYPEGNNNINGLSQYVVDLKGNFSDWNTVSTYTFNGIQQFYFWNSWEDPTATVAIESIYLTKKFSEIRSGLSAGDYGTICLPLGATVTNATVYEIAGVDSRSKISKLYLTEVSEMEAGVPYIFQAENTEDVVFTYSYSGVEPAVAPGSTVGLTGTFDAELIIPLNGFTIDGTNLVAGDGVRSLGDYEAYISPYDLSAVSPTANYISVPSSILTSTSIIEAEDKLVDVYTITGIKIHSQVKKQDIVHILPQGLYIIGSEKVFVKK